MTARAFPYFVSPISAGLSSVDRVREAYRRMAVDDRPEVWITLRPMAEVIVEAEAVDAAVAAGATLRLAGRLVAVKDNIDVYGLPTTAACPEFSHQPARTATAISRLVRSGAIVLGKTNMDQFATGLVGTRSPYGAVRCAWDSTRISGGSSSGSATAVALGWADIGIGTDTAGSGRVPAALNGIIGLKTTLGIVPTTGVLPACVDYDCVTVFAATITEATAAIRVMAGPDDGDPRSRPWPADVWLSAPGAPRVAIPRAADLIELEPGFRSAFDQAIDQLRTTGVEIGIVDISPLLDAAKLLYDGAIVAERYAAVGAFLETRPAGADPTVAGIVAQSKEVTAHAFVDDLQALQAAKRTAAELLSGFDGLMLPTTTEHPTLAAVAAEPLAINRRLGTFTHFCNLLDMAAMAVPGPETADGPFGVMFVVAAFHDQVALDLAARFLGEDPGESLIDGVELAVFGAHLQGEPLNHELQTLGARYIGPVRTSASYRLVVLDTVPPKPGLLRVTEESGSQILGEKWLLSPAALGGFLAVLTGPMSLTSIDLEDGSSCVGFGCSHQAGLDGTDITEYGGWAAYLATSPAEPDPQHRQSADLDGL